MPLHAQARALLDVLAEIAPSPAGAVPTVEERRQGPGLGDAERELLRRRGADGRNGTDGAPEPVHEVTDRTVPGPAGEVPVRVYRPAAAGRLPILVYVHGGGWVIGDLDSDEVVPRALANRAECVVVSVDYRRAPEHPFPASHDDVLAVTRWVSDHGDELDADPTRVVIAGESAGATMATATCLSLAREGHRVPAAQLLVYPITDMVGQDYRSYREVDGTPPLTVDDVRWFVDQETTDRAETHDARLSPLLASGEELAGMPPTLLFTASEDPLRDQGEDYAHALMDAGVHVTLSRFPGMMHGFLGCTATLDGARLAMLQSVAFVAAAFAGREPAAQ